MHVEWTTYCFSWACARKFVFCVLCYLIFILYLTGELKRLRSLVVEAKQQGVKVVPTLVKRMLGKNLLLFGFVDLNEGSKTVNQFTDLQNARLKFAYDKYVSKRKSHQFLFFTFTFSLVFSYSFVAFCLFEQVIWWYSNWTVSSHGHGMRLSFWGMKDELVFLVRMKHSNCK